MNFLLFLSATLYFIQCLANSLASGIGLGFPFNTFLFDPADLFADFVKTLYSYRFLSFRVPASWLSDQVNARIPSIANTFEMYRLSTPFSDNPELAKDALTHFHLPPVTQIYNIAFGQLIRMTDPYASLAIAVLLSLLPLAWACIIASNRSYRLSALLFTLSVISYPCLFAITRGNLSGMLCNSLLILSILLVATNRKYQAILPLAIALSIRPNWYPLLLFILLALPQGNQLSAKLWLLIKWMIAFFCLNFIAYFLAHYLYPGYDARSFFNGYKYYASEYEYGSAGLAFGSSLLGVQKIGLSLIPGSDLFWAVSSARLMNIALASLATIQLIINANRRIVPLESGLIVAITLCMLGTPVFADYHLLVFIGAILYVICRSRLTHALNVTRVDLAFLAITIVPFAYYLKPASAIGLGVVVRPILGVAYVIYTLFSQPWRCRSEISSR